MALGTSRKCYRGTGEQRTGGAGGKGQILEGRESKVSAENQGWARISRRRPRRDEDEEGRKGGGWPIVQI